MLPPERINGLLVMRQEHTTRTPGELLESGETAAGPPLVLQHTPAAFQGLALVAASGGQARPPPAPLPRSQRRGARVRPVDTPTLDDHHDRVPRRAKRGHHLLAIWPQSCGITLWHDLRADF